MRKSELESKIERLQNRLIKLDKELVENRDHQENFISQIAKKPDKRALKGLEAGVKLTDKKLMALYSKTESIEKALFLNIKKLNTQFDKRREQLNSANETLGRQIQLVNETSTTTIPIADSKRQRSELVKLKQSLVVKKRVLKGAKHSDKKISKRMQTEIKNIEKALKISDIRIKLDSQISQIQNLLGSSSTVFDKHINELTNQHLHVEKLSERVNKEIMATKGQVTKLNPGLASAKLTLDKAHQLHSNQTVKYVNADPTAFLSGPPKLLSARDHLNKSQREYSVIKSSVDKGITLILKLSKKFTKIRNTAKKLNSRIEKYKQSQVLGDAKVKERKHSLKKPPRPRANPKKVHPVPTPRRTR